MLQPVNVAASGKCSDGSVGGCGRYLANVLMAAITGYENARCLRIALLARIEIAVFIEVSQVFKLLVFGNQADGDEESIAGDELSYIARAVSDFDAAQPVCIMRHGGDGLVHVGLYIGACEQDVLQFLLSGEEWQVLQHDDLRAFVG